MWDIELNIAGYRLAHQAPDSPVDGRRIVGIAAQRIAGLPAHLRARVRNLRAA